MTARNLWALALLASLGCGGAAQDPKAQRASPGTERDGVAVRVAAGEPEPGDVLRVTVVDQEPDGGGPVAWSADGRIDTRPRRDTPPR